MYEPDFSPPQGLTVSLWRSLLINMADRFAPERLPPLELTSKPVDVGMLEGDRLELPWFRTVFTNISDVIAPELLPPLQLESHPVDVGELLGDELSHPWWNSLLQGLRDRLSPERPAPLQLTSHPIAAFGADSSLQILDWSSLITGPMVFHPDPVPEAASVNSSFERIPEPSVPEPPPIDPALLATRAQLVRDIGRSRFRRWIWISLASAEAVFFLVAIFKMQ